MFNEGSRNSQGEMKRDHDFLKGKIYTKLREGIGNSFKSIYGSEAQNCSNKKFSLSISGSWSATLASSLYTKLRNAIIENKM